MIKINGDIISSSSIANQYTPRSVERKIIDKMASSNRTYEYNSLNELKFELSLRKNIVIAARALNNSQFSFETFRKSKCNTKYWNRTNEGGFLLKEGISPSVAIKDIFINGSQYGTECATAIVIVYYKAILETFSPNIFDNLFTNIQLMNWNHIHKNLRLDYVYDDTDSLPGDCKYFKNPDVNPVTPEWQGENAIDLGNGTYYGHGIGIKTSNEIIKELNRKRKPGATKTAFLLTLASRPDFKYLSRIYYSYVSRLQIERYRSAANYYRNFPYLPPYINRQCIIPLF
ncbi:protein-glutamine gamma-glutamyltransferase [Clostridium sp. DJ247]|uniref:protein-glutamine gamma-glutamyltransferase n=1 Tax=Clostridium sp. DJ247 TaxID=2726188 RepID=UPI0016254FBB|nr:protein-glutamine gamma-glutamyltransferase [Clostridium sp. DJ247]MBC2582026.1 protein-glutamine gamma-glutamyltransferase [Clostridium sp. DJ247]